MATCNNLNHEEAIEIIIKIHTLTSLNLAGRLGTAVAENEDKYHFLSRIGTLTSLDLSFSHMKSLPEGIGEQLVNLTELNLSCCYKLEQLPESICNMRSLTKLDISGSQYSSEKMSLRALPEGFGQLVNLEHLNMYGCSRVQTLPEGMTFILN